MMLVTPSNVTPPPLNFLPSTDMLIHATHMRMCLWHKTSRPWLPTAHFAETPKRIARKRRIRSAAMTSAAGEQHSYDDSDDDEMVVDDDWGWLNEVLDYESDLEGERARDDVSKSPPITCVLSVCYFSF